MAYIFGMGINFGDNFTKAQEQAKFIQSNIEDVFASYSVEDGECWVTINLFIFNEIQFKCGNPSSEDEAYAMTAFGWKCYNKILPLIEGWYFAAVGVETTGFRTIKEIIELIDGSNINYPGLVISSEMKNALTKSVFLQQYIPGYWWSPYLGESYG